MSERLTLPPHLVDKIKRVLADDLDVPSDLRTQLQSSLDRIPIASVAEANEDDAATQDPATIDIDVLEQLSRWATSDSGTTALKKRNIGACSIQHLELKAYAAIDHTEYGMIPLLAGTELYIPSSQIPHLESSIHGGVDSKPNPYLPAYMSPLPPSFGQEYRSLARQLSTVLNILFSIFGSAFAVYVAATTGGGYSREKGILLGVLAGVVVGIADGVLVWIFQHRVTEGREEGRKMAIKLSKGSAGEGEKEEGEAAQLSIEEGKQDGEDSQEATTDMPPAKKEIRLRRRPIVAKE